MITTTLNWIFIAWYYIKRLLRWPKYKEKCFGQINRKYFCSAFMLILKKISCSIIKKISLLLPLSHRGPRIMLKVNIQRVWWQPILWISAVFAMLSSPLFSFASKSGWFMSNPLIACHQVIDCPTVIQILKLEGHGRDIRLEFWFRGEVYEWTSFKKQRCERQGFSSMDPNQQRHGWKRSMTVMYNTSTQLVLSKSCCLYVQQM